MLWFQIINNNFFPMDDVYWHRFSSHLINYNVQTLAAGRFYWGRIIMIDSNSLSKGAENDLKKWFDIYIQIQILSYILYFKYKLSANPSEKNDLNSVCSSTGVWPHACGIHNCKVNGSLWSDEFHGCCFILQLRPFLLALNSRAWNKVNTGI